WVGVVRLIDMVVLSDLNLVRAEGDDRGVGGGAPVALLVFVAVDDPVVASVDQALLEPHRDLELVRVRVQPRSMHRVTGKAEAAPVVMAVIAVRDSLVAIRPVDLHSSRP